MKTTIRKCLVEGYGYMGKIHAGLLQEMGYDVACVSRRQNLPFPSYRSMTQAIQEFSPDFCIVATPTSEHLNSLRILEQMGYTHPVLVEKPLAACVEECDFHPSFPLFVAYNMRFSPVLIRLQEVLAEEEVVAARFSVGGYLPGWRPGTDYRTTYSVRQDMGGGVLRDLSHELDLVRLLLGESHQLTSIVGKRGSLEMDCDDTVDILMSADKCPAINIHLDCLDRNVHRFIALQTATRTIHVNLLRSALIINGVSEECPGKPLASYRRQLQKILTGDYAGLCTWRDGLAVMEIIKAIEMASTQNAWIALPA